jgi:hypothetical protein
MMQAIRLASQLLAAAVFRPGTEPPNPDEILRVAMRRALSTEIFEVSTNDISTRPERISQAENNEKSGIQARRDTPTAP